MSEYPQLDDYSNPDSDMESTDENSEESEEEEDDDDNDDDEERKPRPYNDIRTKIWQAISDLRKSSVFAFGTSSTSLPNPGVFVNDHGIIGLPLSPRDAEFLISKAKQSPFGKGENTLVDVNVRKSWELDASQFSFKNPEWSNTLQTIVSTVHTGLGLPIDRDAVTAELYKLLLYEPGAFFKPHKDSEKVPGMFGTLAVCLPSPHEGGKLILRDRNEIYEFETGPGSNFDFSYAAWYADITHEVLPVTSGYRLVLTYNLIRKTGSVEAPLPSAAGVQKDLQELSQLLQNYNSSLEQKAPSIPSFLSYKLDHLYTESSLGLGALKGPDRDQVQVLGELAPELGFDIYLATSELSVTGKDYYFDGERSLALGKVVNLDGSLVAYRVEGADMEEADINPASRDAGDYDEEEEGEWTGNEGAPSTFWYRDTAAILVPPCAKIDFLFRKPSDCASKIISLLRKFKSEWSAKALSQSDKRQLEKLCELALKEPSNSMPWGNSYGQYIKMRRAFLHPISHAPRQLDSSSMSTLYNEATSTALQIGRFDLFQKASVHTAGRAALVNAHMLGEWVAKKGTREMDKHVESGVRAAASLEERLEFLKTVGQGFASCVPRSHKDRHDEWNRWSDCMLFDNSIGSKKLEKPDVETLMTLSNSMNWNTFQMKVSPKLLVASTTVKVAFINALMSAGEDKLTDGQRSLALLIINKIWSTFRFETVPAQQAGTWNAKVPTDPNRDVNVLSIEDVKLFFVHTSLLLGPQAVDGELLPAMLAAIPRASDEDTSFYFIDMSREILKHNIPGVDPPTPGELPAPIRRVFLQSMLVRYIQTNLGPKPKTPTNWSLPAIPSHGSCQDCREVNRFLIDPGQTSFDFAAKKERRTHVELHMGTNGGLHYTTETIAVGIPYTLRITKHRHDIERQKREWSIKRSQIKSDLSKIAQEPHVKEYRRVYLDPYDDVIVNVEVDQLPALDVLISQPLNETKGETGADADSKTPVAASTRGAQKRRLAEAEDGADKSKKKVKKEELEENKENIKLEDMTDIKTEEDV